MSFREIPAGELNARPFHTLDQEWALLSAGDSKNFNTMTVSWGQLGTLWNLPVATVYVRPQRFTREFLEREDRFTLCFFGGHNQSELAFLGSHSGRDEDKLAATPGLSVSFEYGTSAPVFEQAGMILICKKIYFGDIAPENFIAPQLLCDNYPESDYHRFYVGAVERVLVRE